MINNIKFKIKANSWGHFVPNNAENAQLIHLIK